MSGDCSAKRPNKSPVCGVEVGQCERNNREDEVGVLSVGEVSGGSSNVRNMTCARDDDDFGDNALPRELDPRATTICACEWVRGGVCCLNLSAEHSETIFPVSSVFVADSKCTC